MEEIRFYFDDLEKKLNVVHVSTGKRKVIKSQKKIQRFLNTHGVTLEQCKKVRRDVDRMGLFKRKFFLFKNRRYFV
ncbi:hypothetical protein C1X05_00410 [Laceyella sacchari]|uniref:Arginine repressor, DNA binding domain n=2 Tax=Laceyella TaxID=292635 RepID=A0AA45WRS5_9BACL|nr:hypothetical protein C1X05_00410 [Laceyella sacchari]PRZ16673.1 arginine repressor-like DNA binding protein [Laceyella sediminis]SMP32839.1 Arginine repressor, DNA binding domain [Laceyella tengchongensis]